MQPTINTHHANQITDQQINSLLAGQQNVGRTSNTPRLAGGRTPTTTNSGRAINNSQTTTAARAEKTKTDYENPLRRRRKND